MATDEGSAAHRAADDAWATVKCFLARPRCVWMTVTLLLIGHATLIAWSATRHSPTLNEPGHLVAGLSNWEFGRFELYRVNPPLVRMVAALPVIAAGYEQEWRGFHETPGARPVFRIAEDFIAANGERSLWLFTIARWACIPFSVIGGLFCFLWSRELWKDNLAGLISLTLWCFSPNILAHGELITADAAATSFGLGAGYCFWRWLRQPTWRRSFAAGLLLGLCEISKMTWVILFGLWPLLWLLWVAGRDRQRTDGMAADCSLRREVSFQLWQLTSILFAGLYVINLSYGFDGTFTKLKNFTFISSSLNGLEDTGVAGNRFANSVLGQMPVPLPKQYLIGMDIQKSDFEEFGAPSYLRGKWKDGGWWYYYLYAIAVKTPHFTQLLVLLAVVTLVSRILMRRDLANNQDCASATWRDLVILMAPAVAVLMLVSSQTQFNHHLRYVLPVFGFTFVLAGVTSHCFREQPVIPFANAR